MEARRVVLTGLGALTPVGNTTEEFWAALQQGKSGIGPITRFDTTGYATRIAGEVRNFDEGKYVDKKRPADIVAAVRSLDAAHRDRLQVLMVGGGPLGPELESASAGLPIHYAGFLNQGEITAAYAVADCLVLPSDYGETWGLVVNEALASGVDVIVSDRVGSAEDLAQPLGSAHVFPFGDVAGLARSLQQVAAVPSALAARRALSDAHAPARTVTTVVALLSAGEQVPGTPA